MKMPPIELPTPEFWVAAPPRPGLTLTGTKPSEWGEGHPIYTADQVRSLLLQYAESVREACAKAVEAEALEDPTNSSDDVSYDIAVRDCAAAIRSKED